MYKQRGDLNFQPESPWDHPTGAWGSFKEVKLGDLSGTIFSGAVARTTRQAGASYTITAPYALVYDVAFVCEKWVSAAGTDPAATLDVVVEGANSVATTGATYGATAGNPFANPTTDFASLLSANVNVFGVTQPTLFNIAYAASQTFNMAYYSARWAASASGLSKIGDSVALTTLSAIYKNSNMQLRASETMYPVLNRGMTLNLRLITAAGGANNTVTNLGARVIIIESDVPFDQSA